MKSEAEDNDLNLPATVSRTFEEYTVFNGYRVIGPLMGTDQLWMPKIAEFRKKQYYNRREYLYAPEQIEIETRLQIDARSQHFIILDGTRIIGSVRVTPAPYEFAALAPSLAHASLKFTGYIELSRLVVDNCGSQQRTASCLVVAASYWALANGSKGIVALCRGASRILFERYGLHPTSASPHHIPWRGNEPYALMKGVWPDLIRNAQLLSEKLVNNKTKKGNRYD